MSDLNAFKESLTQNQPPEDLPDLLKALWWDAKGDWDKAHEAAQAINNKDGSWVHAYLHRKEGDEGNASYWYSRARRPQSRLSLKQEWEEIVGTFFEQG